MRWARGFCVEGYGGIVCPVGVAEHFSSDEDHVCATCGDNGFGLMRVGYSADGSGWDLRLAFNGFSKVDLVARADGDLCSGSCATATTIDEIETKRFKGFAKGDAVIECPAAFYPIGGGYSHHEGFIGVEDGAAGFEQFVMKASSILE